VTTYKRMPPERVLYLVVHCADTKPSMDTDAKEIRRWHLQRGFFDIGYHYVIRRSGMVEKGRPDDQPGAHVAGYNGKSLGICLVGGMSQDGKHAEDNFTTAQWVSLKELLHTLKASHPQAHIVGHRELNKGKACPSFDVQAKLREWGWL
jgi:N-acetyl-anhydromuramyl-L-alanine amidase AmpD